MTAASPTPRLRGFELPQWRLDNRKKPATVAWFVALVLMASMALTTTSARRAAADGPSRTGWWNAANTGAVAPPVPPDVPQDGLYVQGSPQPGQPGAFSAVLFDLPSGVAAQKLTLKIADTPSPNLAVQACLIASGDFPGGGNQPASAAPKYNCDSPKAAAGQADTAAG